MTVVRNERKGGERHKGRGQLSSIQKRNGEEQFQGKKEVRFLLPLFAKVPKESFEGFQKRKIATTI